MAAEFEVLMQDYQLEPSLRDDEGYDCITVKVDDLTKILSGLGDDSRLVQIQAATKLYVRGTWNSYFQPDSTQRRKDVAKICELIEAMVSLKELTWISDLPFMDIVWKALPRTLTKLIIDVSQPVEVDRKNPLHKRYMGQEAMKPLIEFTKLRELRIFGMRETFQATIWETVFRNEAEEKGMHVLDLQMVDKPLVRQKHWVKAEDVQGLKVVNEDGQMYRGADGQGVLHYEYGTGEYIDDYCIRKTRIASRIGESKPLPLWCVKLDGFVVDQLPFDHDLSKVVLLTCGSKCIDAGLRAPKISRASTRNKWGPSVDSENTHCLIVFPNWAAIFDNQGRPLDPSGNLVCSDVGESSPASPEMLPLTASSLHLKGLTEVLETVTRRTRASSLATQASADAVSAARLEVASVMTTFGSVVPTPSVQSAPSETTADQVSGAKLNVFSVPTKTHGFLRLTEVEVGAGSSNASSEQHSPLDRTADSTGS